MGTGTIHRALRPLSALVLVTGAFFATSSAAADNAREAQPRARPAAAAAGFEIMSNLNNRCLNVAHFNTGNGASVQTYDCNGNPSERWTENGSEIRSDLSSKCLDLAIGNGDNGATVQMYDCVGLKQQGWHWSGNEIHTDLNHRCLTITDANWWQGASVTVRDCVAGGAAHQQWHKA
ncbi:hypothetical protein GO001_14875 [Streptomyces sp. NRRL B-1677]|uniref:Ricin B lectin domain-containing protein n=1 Tax=Streptomyces klenkii TaxID=1420899 RepID=A0A3B0BR38_9ACTN|nr:MULTISPECIES: ricin-type beta-trefoil lectin domain protein [Streptomyces]MBF6046494.1 hypothetical protein [Streptomyces sp. NRRL B-1677]RKN74689.1 hypothetical protein D7231_12765 [Streptomyces klenkii]